MTERIDHAEEAQKSLESLRSWDTYTHEPAVLKKALVHATLALVEQQRIANLIAWTCAPGYTPSGAVLTEIEEALGLS